MNKETLIILGVVVTAVGLYFVKKKFPATTPSTTTTATTPFTISTFPSNITDATTIAGGQEGSIPSSSLGNWVYPNFVAVDADPNLTTAQKNSCKAAMQVEIDIRNAHPEWGDQLVEQERMRLRNIEIVQGILAHPVNLSEREIRMYETSLAQYYAKSPTVTTETERQSDTYKRWLASNTQVSYATWRAARTPTKTTSRLTSTERRQIAAIKRAVASGDRTTGAKLVNEYYKAHGGV